MDLCFVFIAAAVLVIKSHAVLIGENTTDINFESVVTASEILDRSEAHSQPLMVVSTISDKSNEHAVDNKTEISTFGINVSNSEFEFQTEVYSFSSLLINTKMTHGIRNLSYETENFFRNESYFNVSSGNQNNSSLLQIKLQTDANNSSIFDEALLNYTEPDIFTRNSNINDASFTPLSVSTESLTSVSDNVTSRFLDTANENTEKILSTTEIAVLLDTTELNLSYTESDTNKIANNLITTATAKPSITKAATDFKLSTRKHTTGLSADVNTMNSSVLLDLVNSFSNELQHNITDENETVTFATVMRSFLKTPVNNYTGISTYSPQIFLNNSTFPSSENSVSTEQLRTTLKYESSFGIPELSSPTVTENIFHNNVSETLALDVDQSNSTKQLDTLFASTTYKQSVLDTATTKYTHLVSTELPYNLNRTFLTTSEPKTSLYSFSTAENTIAENATATASVIQKYRETSSSVFSDHTIIKTSNFLTSTSSTLGSNGVSHIIKNSSDLSLFTVNQNTTTTPDKYFENFSIVPTTFINHADVTTEANVLDNTTGLTSVASTKKYEIPLTTDVPSSDVINKTGKLVYPTRETSYAQNTTDFIINSHTYSPTSVKELSVESTNLSSEANTSSMYTSVLFPHFVSTTTHISKSFSETEKHVLSTVSTNVAESEPISNFTDEAKSITDISSQPMIYSTSQKHSPSTEVSKQNVSPSTVSEFILSTETSTVNSSVLQHFTSSSYTTDVQSLKPSTHLPGPTDIGTLNNSILNYASSSYTTEINYLKTSIHDVQTHLVTGETFTKTSTESGLFENNTTPFAASTTYSTQHMYKASKTTTFDDGTVIRFLQSTFVQVLAVNLTEKELQNVVHTFVGISGKFCEKECIDNKTLLFHMWLIQTVFESVNNYSMNWSEISRFEHNQRMSDNISVPVIIFLQPSPCFSDGDLIFTFCIKSNKNGIISADTILPLLKSNAEMLLNILNADSSQFVLGYSSIAGFANCDITLDNFVSKYGVLVVSISLIVLVLAVVLLAVIVYKRQKSRAEVHFITDNEKLHCSLRIDDDVGNVNPALLSINDEVCAEKHSVGNGNALFTVGDDEGWLVPIKDVPVVDKCAPAIQDTKM